jgi:crotonobetainyl-CoA:carnitine CoA-transferase CaiB-like acyl-CoA transferase
MARILDLTAPCAAYATRLLSEAGHDVIRIEPTGGDSLRRRGPFVDGAPVLESGADHQFLNAGKRSVTLDLGCDAGQRVFLDLVGSADVLVANVPLPFDEQRLVDKNPRLVFIQVIDREPELCAVARSGLLSITGQPGGRPAVPGAHVAYALVGLYAAVAAAIGIHARDLTGEGQSITVSVNDCLVSMMEQAMVALTSTGKRTERSGYRGAITAVSGAFPCADGYWMLAVPPTAPEGWRRFVEWTGDPVLMADESLANEGERNAKKEMILDRLDRWSQRFNKLQLVTEGQERHIPSAPVATPFDLNDDPQLVARGFLSEIDHPLFGKIRVPLGAVATVRGQQPSRAPFLGEHTAEVLFELGYSAEAQRALVEGGAV